MAQETEIVVLHDDFYRDGFATLLSIVMGLFVALVAIIFLMVYLDVTKPPPVTFTVGSEWRIKEPVPLDQPYLADADILQWISEVLPNSFDYDFLNYNEQLQKAQHNFTAKGWVKFLDQLNVYANYNSVQTNKIFIDGAPGSVPSLINQGLTLGRYGWWIEMPIRIRYSGNSRSFTDELKLKVLVVRVPTLNNLVGIGIDDVILLSGASKLERGG